VSCDQFCLLQVCKIHRTLPPGGILVFLTGRQEINTLVKKLNSIFPSKPAAASIEKKKGIKKLFIIFAVSCDMGAYLRGHLYNWT